MTLNVLVVFLLFSVALGQMGNLEPCDAFAGGRHTQAHYSCCGTWNNVDVGRGYGLDGCSKIDVSFPGNPWQSICYQFDYVKSDWAIPFTYVGNSGDTVTPGEPYNEFQAPIESPICNYTVESVSTYPSEASATSDGVKHVMKVGPLLVTKVESWQVGSMVNKVTFYVEYPESCCGNLQDHYIRDFTINWAVDPDPDYHFGQFNTINTNAYGDYWTESVGPSSCTSIGLGKCNPDSRVGHTDWVPCPHPWWIINLNGDDVDFVMNFQHVFPTVQCGDALEVSFLVVWGQTAREARDTFQEAYEPYCGTTGTPDFSDEGDVFWPETCQCNEPDATANGTLSKCTCSPGIEDFGQPHFRKKRGVPLEECPFHPNELFSAECVQEQAMWAVRTKNDNYLHRLVERLDELQDSAAVHYPNVYSEVKKTLDALQYK